MFRYLQDLPYYYKDVLLGKFKNYVQPYWLIEYNANKVTDGLYISDFASACNVPQLKEDGITHILCTILSVDEIFPDDFVYKNIHARDIEEQDLSQYFEECNQFIDDAIEGGGNVLIHCSYGVSRSATMVIAYLISKGIRYNKALQMVKDARPIAQPNKGFKKQLIVYDIEKNCTR